MIWLYILCAIVYIGSCFWFYNTGWDHGFDECMNQLAVYDGYQDKILELEKENYELFNKKSE